MFSKLLCAIDFSPGSQQALQVAARMAKELDAELVLVHVWYVPSLGYSEGWPVAGWDGLRERSERMLEAAQQQVVSTGVSRVSTMFISGIPWLQIAELTRDREADLVVIGAHGPTGGSRFALGSVAEQVVRHAHCSVLVARGDSAVFRHVLCPVDFSVESDQATRRAGEIARESITLFHAIEMPALFAFEPNRTAEASELESRATRTLEDRARELKSSFRGTVSTRANLGSPASAVLAVLEDNPELDLVVVGSRGRTGLRRLLLGSVAEKIVRHARTSVLVARA